MTAGRERAGPRTCPVKVGSREGRESEGQQGAGGSSSAATAGRERAGPRTWPVKVGSREGHESERQQGAEGSSHAVTAGRERAGPRTWPVKVGSREGRESEGQQGAGESSSAATAGSGRERTKICLVTGQPRCAQVQQLSSPHLSHTYPRLPHPNPTPLNAQLLMMPVHWPAAVCTALPHLNNTHPFPLPPVCSPQARCAWPSTSRLQDLSA